MPLSPEDEDVGFNDLFDIDEIQRIQDEFAAATGVASIITRPDGTPLTAPSNFTHLCLEVIRKTEKGCANCYKSDAIIGRVNRDGPIVQPCLSGGLWDAGASITIGGKHIANWLIGQVRDETQTEQRMRAYAHEIGADEALLVKSFYDVPSMSREQFERIARALFTLANQLSTKAYQNLQLRRENLERKNAEAKINALLEEKAALLDNTMVGIYTTENRKITSCNQHFLHLFGYELNDVIGISVRILYSDDDAYQAAGKSLYEELSTTGQTSCDIQLRRKDGTTFWAYVSGKSMDVLHPEGIIVWMMSDITARKESEELLVRSNRELEQFAYVASHDLQTPLRNIVSFSQMLARRYKGSLDQDADEFIDFIVHNGMRMSMLVHDLLDFSRTIHSWGQFETVDMKAVYDEAIENLAGSANESQAIVVVGDLPMVLGSHSHLVCLFQNLIGNAMKYRLPNRPPRIEVGCNLKQQEWRFHVADNGIGIDSQFAERIFMIFQRLHGPDSSYEGNGIGLAICKRIVEQHNGRIWVEGEIGRGCTFFFTIPKTLT